jgi:hypothetical protein
MLFNEPFGGLIPGARGAVLATLMRTGAPLTGRQIGRLVGNRYSLWTVQQALIALAQLGLTETQTVGRAGIHAVNERHYAVGPLRMLFDPIEALTNTVRDIVGEDVEAVILFGSVLAEMRMRRAISIWRSSHPMLGIGGPNSRRRSEAGSAMIATSCT